MAVKLAIDSMLLGEPSDNSELQENLEEYEQQWYIGCEKDPQWTQSVLKSVPNLFSLSISPSEVQNCIELSYCIYTIF